MFPNTYRAVLSVHFYPTPERSLTPHSCIHLHIVNDTRHAMLPLRRKRRRPYLLQALLHGVVNDLPTPFRSSAKFPPPQTHAALALFRLACMKTSLPPPVCERVDDLASEPDSDPMSGEQSLASSIADGGPSMLTPMLVTHQDASASLSHGDGRNVAKDIDPRQRNAHEESLSILMASLGAGAAALCTSQEAGMLLSTLEGLANPGSPRSGALFRQHVTGAWTTEVPTQDQQDAIAASLGSGPTRFRCIADAGAGWGDYTREALRADTSIEGPVPFLKRARNGPSPRFGHVAAVIEAPAGLSAPSTPYYAGTASSTSREEIMLVHGGRDSSDFLDDMWLYWPSCGRWRRVEPAVPPSPQFGDATPPPQPLQPSGRSGHTATRMPNGRLVFYGGSVTHEMTTTELWELDPETMTWTLVDAGNPFTPSMPAAHHSPYYQYNHAFAHASPHQQPTVPHGYGYGVGGSPGAYGTVGNGALWQYNGALGGGYCAAIRPVSRKGHTAVVIDGLLLVYGGATQDCRPDPFVWAWDHDTRCWSLLAPANGIGPCARRYHCAEVTPRGEMIVFGGQEVRHTPMPNGPQVLTTATVGGHCLNDVHLFNPRSRMWRRVDVRSATAPEPRMCHTSLLRGDTLAIFDGADLQHVMPNTHHQLDLTTGTWTRLPNCVIPKPHGANRGTTVLIGNSLTMFAGHTGTDFSSAVVSLRLYPPTLRSLAARWLLTHHPAVLDAVPITTDRFTPSRENSMMT
jgi:hypothetical protein